MLLLLLLLLVQRLITRGGDTVMSLSQILQNWFPGCSLSTLNSLLLVFSRQQHDTDSAGELMLLAQMLLQAASPEFVCLFGETLLPGGSTVSVRQHYFDTVAHSSLQSALTQLLPSQGATQHKAGACCLSLTRRSERS